MADKVQFFAWAAPANDINILPDHTWVTTYDSRKTAYQDIKAVVGAEHEFWYCWGNFRSKGGTSGNPTGFLGSIEGDLGEAYCLVEPNANCRVKQAARGTIFVYGSNGVCHQLANQVLYATGTDAEAPLTVASARGYWASTFRYGSYGVPEATWDSKRDTCRTRRRRTPHQPKGGKTMPGDSDEFEIRARTLLKGDPKLLADLLALRTEAQRLSTLAPKQANKPTARALNADNQRMLDQAAALLGPDKFERIFELSPDQRVELVNPKILQIQRRRAAEQGHLHPTFRPAILRQQASKTPSTVTLKNLAAALSEKQELSKKQAEAILNDLVGRITKHLKKGERIRIVGLGVLQVRKRAARMGRNPATGETIHIKASKKVAFRASKDLKDAI